MSFALPPFTDLPGACLTAAWEPPSWKPQKPSHFLSHSSQTCPLPTGQPQGAGECGQPAWGVTSRSFPGPEVNSPLQRVWHTASTSDRSIFLPKCPKLGTVQGKVDNRVWPLGQQTSPSEIPAPRARGPLSPHDRGLCFHCSPVPHSYPKDRTYLLVLFVLVHVIDGLVQVPHVQLGGKNSETGMAQLDKPWPFCYQTVNSTARELQFTENGMGC